MKLFKEIHEFLSSVLIALIIAHISGVLFDRLIHKKHETLKSIATGFKVTQENESIKLNIFQKIFAFLMFIAFMAFLIFNLYESKNILTVLFQSTEHTSYIVDPCSTRNCRIFLKSLNL